MKLFLAYVASSCPRPIMRLQLADLSAQRERDLLNTMEVTCVNRVSTRNQRLALAYLLPLPRTPTTGNAG